MFRPAAAKHVAHRNVPALQKTQAAAAKSEAQQAYADTTYDTTWSAKVGSETVSLKYYGPGHTSGDSVVTIPEREHRAHGRPDVLPAQPARRSRPPARRSGTGSSRSNLWRRSIPADTIYIAGHSKVNLPVTVTRADLLKFRDYFSGLLAYVQKGIASGQSAAEIVKVASVPGFADYEGSPEGTIQAAYEELTAKG